MKSSYRLLTWLLGVVICVSMINYQYTDGTDSKEVMISENTAVSETTEGLITSTEVPAEATTTPEPTAEPVTIDLLAIGDMLMHPTVSNQAKWSGNWDYTYLFSEIKDDVAAADLAVVNNEVIFGGNERGIQGYPCFNVRTELGDAEVAVGFDVILGATNHTMDQDTSGIRNCLNFWKTNYPDIALLGIHESQEAANEIKVIDVSGIKIAVLNYTYSLNGIDLPEGYEYMVDLMTEDTKSKIADDLKRADDLADFVIVFPHWGTEYELHQTEEQEAWAKFFANNGADLIIGAHPHVCEPVEWVEADDGRKVLCYYSLGNYTSLQALHYSMLGGMAKVSITKDGGGTYISDYEMKFLVTHYNGDRSEMTTYYLEDYTDELASRHAWTSVSGAAEINADYPFTVAGLNALAKSIMGE